MGPWSHEHLTMYTRVRHHAVDKALAALNGDFLGGAKCFFGGGTRIVLELKEYRESADIDFLCADRDGYRALRSTITNISLGDVCMRPIKLAREVRADQYGIRTVLQIGDELIKFEIVNEARIDLSGELIKPLHVPCLDRECCFAEKILANDDRWNDESVLSRDVIDLAYMIEAWGVKPFLHGMGLARQAYGDHVVASFRAAAQKLRDNKSYHKKCVDGLRVTKTSTLAAGLKRLGSADLLRKIGP
jgi:hypothetical protein